MTRARRAWLGIGALVLLVVGLAAWGAWSAVSAQGHLQAAREQLMAARAALTGSDPGTAGAAVASAQAEADRAASLANGVLWRAAAAVPRAGDTPRVAREVILAARDAVAAVASVSGMAEGIKGSGLVRDGAVDVARVSTWGGQATAAQASLEAAETRLAEAPSPATGGWVVAPVEAGREALSQQLAQLRAPVDLAAKVGSILPPLLGMSGPRTYLLVVQNPNESRGTGGLVGTWAILTAASGRITIGDVGSNTDLPNIAALPAGFDPEYENRYGSDPVLEANMTISPDFQAAAQLLSASWKRRTGSAPDGVVSIDVTAIGDLLTAAGSTIVAPDGQSLDGAGFTRLALSGVYEKFPESADAPARKVYQEAVARQAIAAIVAVPRPTELARALATAVSARRVAVWVAESGLQDQLETTPAAHTLAGAVGHSVEPVVINVGWSKLDPYIDRRISYQVGRCQDAQGMVASTLVMILTSDLPQGQLPAYVVGTVPIGREGPINKVLAQAHLPRDAVVTSVVVDRKPQSYTPFTEAGRPGAYVHLNLPPHHQRRVEIRFLEPAGNGPGQVLVQPLAREAQVDIRDEQCPVGS